jgi:hypothetical protein
MRLKYESRPCEQSDFLKKAHFYFGIAMVYLM